MTATGPTDAADVLHVKDEGVPPQMPSGTVTFLFTDIEGSTRLSVELGPRWEPTLDEHRRRIRAAVAAAGGREVSTDGDALFVVFGSPSAAVAAAARAQRALAEPWPDGQPIRVRMGVHTGEAALTAGDYVGYEVHRAARVAAAGHGGQVLVSSATRALVEDRLPEGVSLRDLGDYHLKDIARPERLSQLVIEGLPNDFPSPRTLDATPNNLPVQLTSFVGRADLLAEARSLLERTRLLTLTGPGGTGKTRLALELAADVATQFSDGVFFVALASLSDPALFAPTVAAAATIPPTGTRPPMEQLMEGLRGKRTLIVLDNFEQLLGAAPYVAELLRGTDFLKVLVTSRAVLRVSGEQELPVPPLALPDPKVIRGVAALSQYDAVAPVHRARDGSAARLRGDQRERAGDRRDHGAPRRVAAGDRTRRGPAQAPVAPGDPRPSRRPAGAAVGRGPGPAGATADAACRDRVELRPPGCRRTRSVRAARRVRQRLDGGGGRGPRGGRRGAGARRVRRPRIAVREEPRPFVRGRPRSPAVPDARNDPRLRDGALRRAARRPGTAAGTRRVVHGAGGRRRAGHRARARGGAPSSASRTTSATCGPPWIG